LIPEKANLSPEMEHKDTQSTKKRTFEEMNSSKHLVETSTMKAYFASK
jgi:hypothetical protein